MTIVSIHQRKPLEEYLLRDPEVNVLSIGDLDPFFWPYTTWYGEISRGRVEHLALLYSGAGMPVLLCLDPPMQETTCSFVRDLFRLLPTEVYAHFRPGLEAVFGEAYALDAHGLHYKMALRDPVRLEGWDLSAVHCLTPDNLHALQDLYDLAYPGNFFDPRMLETGQYYGIWDDNRLISAAGIHVYSEQYRVAGIGNVTTLPECRGQGLAKLVCAKLTAELRQRVTHVTLNVKADNQAAISTYRNLGFAVIAEYGEYVMHRRSNH